MQVNRVLLSPHTQQKLIQLTQSDTPIKGGAVVTNIKVKPSPNVDFGSSLPHSPKSSDGMSDRDPIIEPRKLEFGGSSSPLRAPATTRATASASAATTAASLSTVDVIITNDSTRLPASTAAAAAAAADGDVSMSTAAGAKHAAAASAAAPVMTERQQLAFLLRETGATPKRRATAGSRASTERRTGTGAVTGSTLSGDDSSSDSDSGADDSNSNKRRRRTALQTPPRTVSHAATAGASAVASTHGLIFETDSENDDDIDAAIPDCTVADAELSVVIRASPTGRRTPAAPPQPPQPPRMWRPAEYDLWDSDKQTCWDGISTNPQRFYYKYTPPGVPHNTSEKWTAAERKQFFRAILTHPVSNDEWGFFSMHVPGRTGAQCHSFYESFMRQRTAAGTSAADASTPVSADGTTVVTADGSAEYHRLKNETERELFVERSDFTAAERASPARGKLVPVVAVPPGTDGESKSDASALVAAAVAKGVSKSSLYRRTASGRKVLRKSAIAAMQAAAAAAEGAGTSDDRSAISVDTTATPSKSRASAATPPPPPSTPGSDAKSSHKKKSSSKKQPQSATAAGAGAALVPVSRSKKRTPPPPAAATAAAADDESGEAEVLSSTPTRSGDDSSSPITVQFGGSAASSSSSSSSAAAAAANSSTHIHIHVNAAAASAAHGPVEPKVMTAYEREQSRLEAIFQLERQRLERYHSVQLARIQDRFRLLSAAAANYAAGAGGSASAADFPPLAISMSAAMTDDAWTEHYPKKGSQFGFFEGCKVLMSMFRGQNETFGPAGGTAGSAAIAAAAAAIGSSSFLSAAVAAAQQQSSSSASNSGGSGGNPFSALFGSSLSPYSTGSDSVDSAESVDLALRRSHASYKELKREMDLRHKVQRETLASMHTHGIV